MKDCPLQLPSNCLFCPKSKKIDFTIKKKKKQLAPGNTIHLKVESVMKIVAD